ncbi:MAG: hypothetical protein ACYC96_14135 [Fimbriimonadaceae bacterium]
MIAPVRIWTRRTEAKKACLNAIRPVTPAAKKATPGRIGLLSAWERLWAHHIELTAPKFEE